MGGILFEQSGLAVEHTYAGGAEHLVAGERVEIAIEGLNVDLHVGHGLRTVDEYGRSVAVRHAGDFGYGIDRAERIRYMHDRNQFGARGSAAFRIRPSAIRRAG